MTAADSSIEPDSFPITPRSLHRNTAVMASGTAVSRILGFVRNALLVAVLGVDAPAANAFDRANAIPTVMYSILLSGVLNAVVVPQIVRALARKDGKRTVDRIITLGSTMLFAITVVLTVGSAVMISIYTSGWSSDQRALAIAFALWCMPQVFFYGMYALLGQVLNARERFGPYMWAPVANNVVAIVGLVAFLLLFGRHANAESTVSLASTWGSGKIALLAGVATLGIVAQAVVLIRPLIRSGYRWRFQWSGPHGELDGVKKVAGWTLAAVLVEQVGVAWCSRIASAAPATQGAHDVASNAAYTNALLIYLVPHSLVTVSIVTALFTGMSRFGAANDMPGLRGEVSRGLRTIAIFSIFSTAALVALAPAAVRVLVPSATAAELGTISPVVIAMSLGLVPLGAMVLIKAAYFAVEDGRSLFLIQIPMAVALVGIALLGQALLEPRWWVVAIGVGMASSNAIAMALRLGGLRRRLGGLDGRRVAQTHVRAVLAVMPALVVGWFAVRLGPDVTPVGFPSVALAAAICALVGMLMLGLYILFLTLLGVHEGRAAVAPIVRKLRRRVR